MPEGREFWRFGTKMSSELVDHHVSHNSVEVTNCTAERVFGDLFIITMNTSMIFVASDQGIESIADNSKVTSKVAVGKSSAYRWQYSGTRM